MPRTNAPKLVFTRNREEASTIRISEKMLEKRKQLKKQKIESIIDYSENISICRTQQLLDYFGEENNFRCGKCDVCVERNKLDISDLEFEKIKKSLENILSEKEMISSEIVNRITDVREEKIIKVLQWLIDNGQIKLIENKYSWIV